MSIDNPPRFDKAGNANPGPGSAEAELRDRAIKRLKKRHDFKGHLLIYVLVNSFIVVIWAFTSSGGFFWPIFPIVGWGIGVVMNAWDVYGKDDLDEDSIQREMNRLKSER